MTDVSHQQPNWYPDPMGRHELADPLRQMVYASAITVDTALKQDARGLNSGGVLDMFSG